MGAIDEIRARKAAREKEQSDLSKYAAIQQQMQDRERVIKEQEAFDLGAVSERGRYDGLYGASIGDSAFGTGGPAGAIAEYAGGDIPSWLADGIIGAGDAISSGMDSVSNYFADAAGPTPEEAARDAALGEQLRRSMQEGDVWAPAGSPASLYNSDSSEVSKDDYIRFERIFNDQSKGTTPLTDVETNNAYNLIKSDKNFSDDEIRQLAKQKTY
jgi:hypothetical protein